MDRDALERDDFKFNVHLVLGGQVRGEPPGLFIIYPQGNPLQASEDSPYLQIGETKYGRPILDRGIRFDRTTLEEAAKYALLSLDSTMRSNVTVGPPIDLLAYEVDELEITRLRRFPAGDPDLIKIGMRWEQALRQAVGRLPQIRFRARRPTGAVPDAARGDDRARRAERERAVHELRAAAPGQAAIFLTEHKERAMRIYYDIRLSDRTITKRELEGEAIVKAGRYFIAKTLLELGAATVDPLSPANPLIFSAGPFAGTSFSNANRTSVGCKSPLTGGIKEANGGGSFSYGLGQQKIAGFTLLDASPDWVVIHFKKDGAIEFDDAGPYLGKGNFEAQNMLHAQVRQEGDDRALRPGGRVPGPDRGHRVQRQGRAARATVRPRRGGRGDGVARRSRRSWWTSTRSRRSPIRRR